VPIHAVPYPRWGGGFPEFGIAYNAIPSRDPNSIGNNFWVSYFGDAVIVINPPIGLYYIAVFGLEESGYAIAVLPFSVTPNQTSTQAIQIADNTLNQGGLIAAIVIIIVVPLVVVGVIGGFIWWKKRKGRTFNAMTDEDQSRQKEGSTN